MQRIGDFEKLPGALAKRSGPLVAVILSPADPDAAERLLAQVRYQAEITDNEYTPTRRDNIGNLVINAFILTGILGAFCIVSGLCAGGIRAIRRRGKRGDELDPMILLHLDRL
jgi:O-antigen ligase